MARQPREVWLMLRLLIKWEKVADEMKYDVSERC